MSVNVTIKWDLRFLHLARHVSEWSKDRTKVGAVIARPDRVVAALGYNGLPRGVNDDPERYENRERKLKTIVHAEANALLMAKQDLTGFVLYTWPMQSCSRCAGLAIQSGIVRVVAPAPPQELLERWEEDFELAQQMFTEAGVTFVLYPLEKAK